MENNERLFKNLNQEIRSRVKISDEDLAMINDKFQHDTFKKNEI